MVAMEEMQNHTSLDNEAGTVENVDQKESNESLQISENESETDEEESQNLPSENSCVINKKKYIISLSSLKVFSHFLSNVQKTCSYHWNA